MSVPLEVVQNATQSPPQSISIIPDDVLQQIFITFVDSVESSGQGQGHATQAPLLIASVNHHWRDLALSTARLWSRLYIRTAPSAASTEREIQRVNLWMERSRLCTLEVIIFQSDTGRKCLSPADRVLLGRSLLPCLHRVIALVLQMEGQIAANVVSSWQESDDFTLPQLKRLEIRPQYWDDNWPLVMAHLLSATTSLDRLVCPRTGFPGLGIIPWSSLRTFRGGLSPSNLLPLMTAARIEVIDLHLGNTSDKWDYIQATPVRETSPPLSHLSFLSLSCGNLAFAHHHFPALPALRYLSVSRDNLGSIVVAQPGKGLSDMLQLWGFNLLYFRPPGQCPSTILMDLLSLTPNLEALRIHYRDLVSTSAHGQIASKLPLLTHLELELADRRHVHQDLLCIETHMREKYWPFLCHLTLRFLRPLNPNNGSEDVGLKEHAGEIERIRKELKNIGIELDCVTSHPRVDYYTATSEYFRRKGGIFAQPLYIV